MERMDKSGNPAAGETWIPKKPASLDQSHMTADFARVYELTATRVTGPISMIALQRAGQVGRGTRVLDVAAGAGALSIPAALSGASVLAVDIAPGMVQLLGERLAPFPNCEARIMDGQALDLEDASFDAAFSIIGVNLFADWRRGLAELARVVRSEGKTCIATWRTPPGGGPFLVMAQALRSVFPDRPPPTPPEGFVVLSDPERLRDAMLQAGFIDIDVEEIDVVWEGASGQSYLDELRELHRYMGPYAALEENDRRKIDEAIISIVSAIAKDGRVALHSPVLIATGTRA